MGKISNNGTKDVKGKVPLKYPNSFWGIPEMPLINFESNLLLTWSENCFITDVLVDNQVPRFQLTDKNLYSPVVRSST